MFVGLWNGVVLTVCEQMVHFHCLVCARNLSLICCPIHCNVYHGSASIFMECMTRYRGVVHGRTDSAFILVCACI